MFGWILGTGSRRLTTGQKVAREVTRRTGNEIGAALSRRRGTDYAVSRSGARCSGALSADFLKR